MIDIANLYLDDSRPKQVAEFPSVNSAMYKLSLDAGHYYNKIDQERNSTPTRLKDFVFPRPPQVQSIRPVSTSSACNGTSDSDTQSDSDCRCRPRTRPKRSSPIAIHTSCNANHQESLTSSSPMTFQSLPSFLPPIGVFWDIENCNVPKGCSAVLVAQVIRDSFFDGYREAEFLVVCDVTKEPSKVIQELNDAQVNLIHVPSLHKNAADEKLRQSMRRFADIHGSPAAVVLITGDINFISDVSDLRHRRKIHVILLHQDNTSESLILCANESHNILRLFEALPPRESKTCIEPYQLTVHNLPSPVEPARIRSRLKRISDNCGGRVVEVMTGAATINFSTRDLAQRAQKRMSGADVFGNKITVGPPRRCAATPTKNGAGGGATVAPPPQQVVTATHFTATSSVYTQFTPAAGGSWSDKRQNALQYQRSFPDPTPTAGPCLIVNLPKECAAHPSGQRNVSDVDQRLNVLPPWEAVKAPIVTPYPDFPRSGFPAIEAGMHFNVRPDGALNVPIVNQYPNPPQAAAGSFLPSIVKFFEEHRDVPVNVPIPRHYFNVPPPNVNQYLNVRPNGAVNVPTADGYGNIVQIGNMSVPPPNMNQYYKVGWDGTVNVSSVNQHLDVPPPHMNRFLNNLHSFVNVPPPSVNQYFNVPPPSRRQLYSIPPPSVNRPPPGMNRFSNDLPGILNVPPPSAHQHFNVPPPSLDRYLHVRPSWTPNVPSVNGQYLIPPQYGTRVVPPQSVILCLQPDGSITIPDVLYVRQVENSLMKFEAPGVRAPRNPTGSGLRATKNQILRNQMANSQNGGSADYSWNQPQPAGASVKKVRENTPERFRPIRKQHQDDASLMPPPIPASNLKTYTSSAKNQVPAVKPEPGVSPYSVTACSTSPYSLTSDDDERFFHPIPAQAKVEFVELQVTNLDQSMETKDMKTMLMKVFSEHVMVLHVTVYIQSDGNVAARVRVPSPADARFAISQLHRRKVGSRRILISYVTAGGPSPQVLKAQIWSLLVDVPGHRLPLFKFCELYESRFIISVGVSDLYKLRDVCVLTEERGGRMISLNPDYRGTLSPLANAAQDALELPFCSLHMDRPGGSDKGWAEQEADVLPTVRIGLQALASRVGQLLLSHKGYLPLPSLPRCYEALFGPLTGDKAGVPLEHVLGCLPGVEIHQGAGCVKYLRWAPAGEADDHQAKCASPPLAQQLDFFSRELVELLKTLPRCLLLFNRFIPAYHHHFGRQCRVADYGYTKLVDLLEALPHTVQVLGEGSKRLVTLSHRAQVRRFTSDLLRLLKAQPSKQVALSEFAAVFLRVVGKEWDVADYGVCDIVDMLNAVSRALVVVTPMENDVNIAILKREQTPTEVSRTKIFADEMDDGAEGEPRVSLTLTESVRVLASQISTVVGAAPASTLLLSRLPAAFTAMFGYALRPEAYGCTSILQLVQSLGDSITVVDSGYGGPMARLRPPSVLYNAQGMKVWRVLVETGAVLCLTATQFFNAYWQCHQEVFSLDSLADFPDIVQVSFAGGELIVQLTATMSFAGDVFHLLLATPGGRLPLARLPAEYGRQFGRSLEPSQFGHASLGSLLAAIGQVAVVLDGETVAVNERLAEVGFKLPGAGSAAPDSSNAFLKGLLGGYKPAFKVDVAKPDTPAKCIPIELGQPKVPDHMSSKLYSPAAGLMCAYKNPAAAGRMPLNIVSPAASQLPMPTSFASRSTESDCEEALVNGSDSHGDNSLDMNSSGNSTPTRVRRKKRLAAHFSTPIET